MNVAICYDCGVRRRVIAPVVDKLKEARRVSKKVMYAAGTQIIVGWRCKKCVQKMYVQATPSTEGNGWRRRFMDLCDQIKKQHHREAPQVQPAHLQPTADSMSENYIEKVDMPAPKTKKSLVDHVKGFFRRTP